MLMSYFRLSMFAYLIILNLMGVATRANGMIQVMTKDQELVELPLDILKEFKTIYNSALDLEVYDESNNVAVRSGPIPLEIESHQLNNIIDILKTAKLLLHVKEMRTQKKIIKNYKLKGYDEKALQEWQAVYEVGSWTWPQMSPDELLSIIQAANYLDTRATLDAAVKIFTKSHSLKVSGFHDLGSDIKKLIVKQLSSTEFMALIRANGSPGEEESYKIALEVFYTEKKLPPGITARGRYEELYSSVGARSVAIPGGTYEIGSPPTDSNFNFLCWILAIFVGAMQYTMPDIDISGIFGTKFF